MREPKLGETLIYTLTEGDAEAINKRRQDAQESMAMHRRHATGAVIHVGNGVREGDQFPLIVTRLWGLKINGQLLLDGTDTLWVTSVEEGDGPRHFRFVG